MVGKKKIKAIKQSLVTVFSGLAINFPLQFLILYVCLEVIGLSSSLMISLITSVVMTLTALIRCYVINIHFDKGNYDE